MELRQYIAVLLKWWWLIALSVIIAAASAFFTTRAIPKTYVSSTTLMVGQALQNPNANQSDLYTGAALAQSYSDLVDREPVLQATLEALGLKWDWTVLQSMAQGHVVAGTQLLEISVVDTDPARAKVLADEIAHQLILQSPSAADPEKEAERQFILTQIEGLKTNIKSAQEEIAQLDDAIVKANSARQIQDGRDRQANLRAQITTWQSTYAQMLSNLQSGTPNYLSVMEPARIPSYPIGPNMNQNVMLAVVIGLALSGSAAFLLEYIDDTIKTPEDVRSDLALSVLGSITDMQGDDYASKLMTVNEPRSPVAEAYRMLRTNLQFSAINRPLRTLLITSSGPLEGKSVTAANLAVAVAQSGKRVVLVDADMRRPVQHQVFQLKDGFGLTSILLDKDLPLAQVLQPTYVDNLRVMASGPIPPDPSELLSSKRMAALFAQLQEQADLVIFDSPPVLVVTDAPVLSTLVDGVLMVIRSGRTRRTVAKATKDALTAVNANVVGVMLNRASTRTASYYYYSRADRRIISRKSPLSRLFHRSVRPQDSSKSRTPSADRTSRRKADI
ncbi:MAG: polysaccharide biosynthesis tyrosine autokinase [Chloroflexi bacterium]|nr:polysaccharide biosynthesis tyrosine autokinase [Chloroflexota bacterium]MCL5274945.1 polysaccharide biosynthesis tyrosine autokinase [Chloroflexota bacterium]